MSQCNLHLKENKRHLSSFSLDCLFMFLAWSIVIVGSIFKNFFIRDRKKQGQRQREKKATCGEPIVDLIPGPWNHTMRQRHTHNH